MRKKLIAILALFILYGVFFHAEAQRVHAENCALMANPNTLSTDFGKPNGGPITFTGNCGFQANKTYSLLLTPYGGPLDAKKGESTWDTQESDGSNSLTFYISMSFMDLGKNHPGNWTAYICYVDQKGSANGPKFSECFDTKDGSDGSDAQLIGHVDILVGEDAIPNDYTLPTLSAQYCVYQVNSDVPLTANNLTPNTDYEWWMKDHEDHNGDISTGDGETSKSFTVPGDAFKDAESKIICADKKGEGRNETEVNCIKLYLVSTDPSNADRTCKEDETVLHPPTNPCPPEYFNRLGGCGFVDTAIGKIETTPQAFIESLFGIILSLAGGIALLLIIYSGYELIASQGNAEKVQAARERLTAAIVGLLFIIFSIVILTIIGVNILKIPGFTE